MSKTVYFVRHGETEYNKKGLLQYPDVPLNETGLNQAAIIADRCTRLDAEVIISSPWNRAHTTAQKVHEATNLPLETSELFHEMKKPSKLWHTKLTDSDFFEQADAHRFEPNWRYSDEENTFDVHDRAKRALAFLEAQTQEKLIVVSHKNFLRHFLMALLHLDPATSQYDEVFNTFLLTNTSISVAKYTDTDPFTGRALGKPNWRIVTWNDHAHLG